MVSDAGAFGESDIGIGRSGIDDFHIGVIVGDQFAEFQSHREDYILLLSLTADSARFRSAMAGVYDKRFKFSDRAMLSHRSREEERA